MYVLYQNKYSNYLSLNLINVRYAKNNNLLEKDFAIRLNNICPLNANDVITFKLYLFLGYIASLNGLRDDILVIDTNDITNTLKVSKKAYIVNSLEYLKAIEFKYNYYISKNENSNKWKTEIRSCKIIDSYTISKGYIKVKLNHDYIRLLSYKIKSCKEKQYVELPKNFFAIDIKNYKHSAYLYFRICLHRKLCYNKHNLNIISVKELVKYCPLLPYYEDLGKQKQVSRSIIKPFENNMNYLAKLFNFKWKYANEITSYISFINNKICFDFNN